MGFLDELGKALNGLDGVAGKLSNKMIERMDYYDQYSSAELKEKVRKGRVDSFDAAMILKVLKQRGDWRGDWNS